MKYLRFSIDNFKWIILSQTIPGFSKLTICLLDNSTWMLSRYLYPMLEILISLFPIYSSTSIPHRSKGYYQPPSSKTHNSLSHLVVTHKLSNLPDFSSEAHSVICDYKLKMLRPHFFYTKIISNVFTLLHRNYHFTNPNSIAFNPESLISLYDCSFFLFFPLFTERLKNILKHKKRLCDLHV